MIFVNLKFDNKIKNLYKELEIDIKKLERFSTFILNEERRTRKDWCFDILVTSDKDYDGALYAIDMDWIEIGLKTTLRSVKTRRQWFLGLFFHELCHFMQDNFGTLTSGKIAYTDEDVDNYTDAYSNCPYEQEARIWEKKYTKVFINLNY